MVCFLLYTALLQTVVCIGILIRKFRDNIAQQLRCGYLFTNFAAGRLCYFAQKQPLPLAVKTTF